MKNIFTFKNIQFTFVATAFAFTMVFVVIPQATGTQHIAEACCGEGGGGDTTGGGEGGGGGGGTPAPTCNISTNIAVVNSGDQYTISWRGTPATGGTFKVNDYPVSAVGQKTYTFTAANYSRFVFTGQTAGGTCVSEVRVNRRVTAAPVCSSFTATPATLPVGGGSVNLVWNTTGATTATLDGQTVAGSGSLGVQVTANKTFALTLSNSVGQVSCTAPVTVATPTPLPTCDSFTAAPTSIVRGHSSILTWATTNATVVSINNGVGSVEVDGTYTVTPNNTTTYTLTATRDSKTVTCTKTVTVTDVPTPTCDSFTASPTIIDRGQSSTLTWNTTNASSTSINNAVGGVAVDGSVSVAPIQSTTYTLTAVGAGGAVSCPVTVTVRQPQESTFTCSNNVNFSANPTSFRRGDSSTLTWSTKNGVTSVRFNNGISATGLSGSVSVSPNSDETYVMTVSNGSQTIDCPTSVNVSTSGGGGGGSSSPRCSLKISDNSIAKGERVTLKWDTTRATEITIKDNHGKTLVTTDNRSSNDKRDLYDGEITLRPDTDTTYTLVAERGSRDKTCTVKVDVKDGVTVIQNRDQQPLVTGIALTQVPYTGFEAGAFLTTLFYALLAMFAAYLAYIFVIRRDGVVVANAAVLPHVAAAQAFVNPSTFTPNFHVPAVAPVVASTATIGYAAAVATEVSGIEARAHAEMILLSADALAQLAAATNETNVAAVTAEVFVKAKASYPSEDGYVTIGLERLNTLLS